MKRIITTAALASSLALTACASASAPEKSETATEETPEPGAPAPPAGNISWGITPRNTYVYPNGNNQTYLYLSLKSGADSRREKRVPLNISLVLDRSGSMSGDKIAYARQAAKFVIDRLGPEDILSIVNYDDKVEVSSAQQYVRNKEELKRKVDRLTDRGGTNLTAGMEEGYRQVQSMKRNGYVNRVLLLTDGLANEGIVSPREIKKIVRDKYNELGIALSTFGLGAGYNEDLLTAMAEVGGANYYFIEGGSQIAGIFDRELKGLLSVLGQDAVVNISLPAGTMCEKVYGYPYEVNDGKITIRLNDIYANDEKGVVIRLRSNHVTEGLALSATLAYTDANNFEKVRETKSLRLPIASSRTAYEESVNAEVEEKVALFEANDEFDEIMAEVDKGNYKEAKVRAEKSVAVLKQKQSARPSAALRDREVQISKYAEDMEQVETMDAAGRSMYQKANKSMNYESKKLRR